jgi:hypothetical protein
LMLYVVFALVLCHGILQFWAISSFLSVGHETSSDFIIRYWDSCFRVHNFLQARDAGNWRLIPNRADDRSWFSLLLI